MILQALHQLAEREDLLPDPDFELKPIAWLIRVSREGRLVGIDGTHHIPPEEEGRKSPRPRAKHFFVPREKPRTSGDRAFFFFDKAEYVFGIDPNGTRSAKKLEKRAGLFRDRVAQCAEETGDEGAEAVRSFLEALASGDQTVHVDEDWASNDLFAFVYAPDVDALVTNRPKVRDYWKELRTQEGEGQEGVNQCLVTGDPFTGEVGNFPPLKRVPGGTSSGVGIVSFNANAFESYGWSGNENAPVSRDAAETCATALNRLLHPAYPDPQQPDQPLPERRYVLSDDTVVCFWSADDRGDELCNALVPVLEANEEEVGNVYRSVWQGRPPDIDDPSAFYALVLKGAQGRATVQDWFESTVEQVVQNVAQHFADLAIVRNVPKPKKRGLPPQLPLRLLLESLATRGDRAQIPAHLAAQVFDAAVRGTLYPFSVLTRAIERSRAEVGRSDWADLNRRDARAALIKAVLNRRKRRMPETTLYKEVTSEMDPKNQSPGYLLGRLLAVIERMQQTALGDVNASVVDRYFSGASATPAAVFPRLLKNLRHHARKAKDNDQTSGTAGWLDKQADEIASGLDGFPAHLDLEQQGLFVLGYHHQRHWLWMSKEDRAAAEANAEA
ncbi:MAG: type I-C CRISPR-associated protein Cas8c/Csd1 [Planctomycetota bacterium]